MDTIKAAEQISADSFKDSALSEIAASYVKLAELSCVRTQDNSEGSDAHVCSPVVIFAPDEHSSGRLNAKEPPSLPHPSSRLGENLV